MEWLRSRLQESEQARGAGIHLGAAGAGAWSPSDSDWLSAARMGRRRRAVAGSALADVSVGPLNLSFSCHAQHAILDSSQAALSYIRLI
jgi:hypothetical protein